MSNEPKYRPSLTLAQIDALVAAVGYQCDSSENVSHLGDAIDAAKVLRVFQFKAQVGVTAPASIPTGNKPGRPSAMDIMRQDAKETKQAAMTYEEAVYQNSIWPHSLQPLPTNIQAILDAGESQA